MYLLPIHSLTQYKVYKHKSRHIHKNEGNQRTTRRNDQRSTNLKPNLNQSLIHIYIMHHTEFEIISCIFKYILLLLRLLHLLHLLVSAFPKSEDGTPASKISVYVSVSFVGCRCSPFSFFSLFLTPPYTIHTMMIMMLLLLLLTNMSHSHRYIIQYYIDYIVERERERGT